MVNAEKPTSTILVIDDNPANRSLAEHTLQDEGYRVVLAKGGVEGVAAFVKEQPDCVLLDVQMADMDGFAVCQQIRAFPRGSETPILFLTALRDVNTFDRALRSGGDDFLTKPVQPIELVVRVQTALKLRRMKAELREHYVLLRQQRDALFRLQLQKERLMALVVHDLKTPVNTVDLHAQLLIRAKDTPVAGRDSAMKIRAAARDLTRMVHNLLDLSKADEGQLQPRRCEFDLRGLVSAVITELEFTAQCHQVDLRSSLAAIRIYADEDLVRRTLTNLVENAIRYAPPATSVTISAVDGVGGTELRVRDAGTGIPADMHDRVFDAFTQVESGEHVLTRGSHGLGLTFCKLIVEEAHGGRIWIEDAAPGAIFCMRFPHGPEGAGAVSPEL